MHRAALLVLATTLACGLAAPGAAAQFGFDKHYRDDRLILPQPKDMKRRMPAPEISPYPRIVMPVSPADRFALTRKVRATVAGNLDTDVVETWASKDGSVRARIAVSRRQAAKVFLADPALKALAERDLAAKRGATEAPKSEPLERPLAELDPQTACRRIDIVLEGRVAGRSSTVTCTDGHSGWDPALSLPET